MNSFVFIFNQRISSEGSAPFFIQLFIYHHLAKPLLDHEFRGTEVDTAVVAINVS